MSNELARKLVEQLKGRKCSRKNCLSQQRDALEVAWFGQQYAETRDFTCSACLLCNDEAIKNSLPTCLNVLPVSLFAEKFVGELRAYEAARSSKDYYPKLLREQSRDLLVEMGKFEVELGDALGRLATALALFAKQVEEANGRIFRHQIFEEILSMNNEEKWEGLLEKVLQLVTLLNTGETGDYRFSNLDDRNKQLSKLNATISDITLRSLQTLREIHDELRAKNELMGRL